MGLVKQSPRIWDRTCMRRSLEWSRLFYNLCHFHRCASFSRMTQIFQEERVEIPVLKPLRKPSKNPKVFSRVVKADLNSGIKDKVVSDGESQP